MSGADRYFIQDAENRLKSLLVKLFSKSKKISPSGVEFSGLKSILVIRQHDPMGDVLLSSAVFSNLRAYFPAAKIDVITRPGLKDIFLNNRYISEVLVFEKKKMFLPWYYFKIKRQLQSREYKLALVIGSTSISFLSLFLARLSGAGLTAGYDGKNFNHKEYTERFLNVEVPYDENNSLHQTEKNLDLLRYLNIPVISNSPHMDTSAEEDNLARAIYEKNGIKYGQLLIGLHPGASRLDHRWPLENFVSAGDLLAEKLGAQIVVFSGVSERHLSEEYRKKTKHKVFTAPLLGLREFAALVKPLSLFICNDTGVLHIAAALDVKTLAIFARTDPLIWNPAGSGHYYLRANDRIISSVKIEEVTAKAFEILA